MENLFTEEPAATGELGQRKPPYCVLRNLQEGIKLGIIRPVTSQQKSLTLYHQANVAGMGIWQEFKLLGNVS